MPKHPSHTTPPSKLGLSNVGDTHIKDLQDSGRAIQTKKIGSKFKGIKTFTPILAVSVSKGGVRQYTCRGTFEQ